MDLLNDISCEIARIINCNNNVTTNIKKYIEMPNDTNRGDYVFQAFKVSKILNISPKIIALKIQKYCSLSFVKHIEVIDSYVNFYINEHVYIEYSLKKIIRGNAKGYKIINLSNNHYSNIIKEEIILFLQNKNIVFFENNCMCVSLKKYNYSPFILIKDGNITDEAIILFKVICYIRKFEKNVCVCIYNEDEHCMYEKISLVIKIINEKYMNKFLFISNFEIKVIGVDKLKHIINTIYKGHNFIEKKEKCILKKSSYSVYNEVKLLNKFNNLLNESISKDNISLLYKYIISICDNLNEVLNFTNLDKDIMIFVKGSLNILENSLLFFGIDVSLLYKL